MDIIEAIRQRKSIRAFKPDAVPQRILREILELALRAPSYANIQPCEFAIVSGETLEKVVQAFLEKVEEPPDLDFPEPQGFPAPYDARRRALGMKVFQIEGISRDDREKRAWWELQGLTMFEAPSLIYICTDRSLCFQGDSLNVWPIFDCGLVAENIMLLAPRYGLGTIPQTQSIRYTGVLRKILGIPDSKLILLGIAIGYPDWNNPINQFRSEREPLDKVAKWYGSPYQI